MIHVTWKSCLSICRLCSSISAHASAQSDQELNCLFFMFIDCPWLIRRPCNSSSDGTHLQACLKLPCPTMMLQHFLVTYIKTWKREPYMNIVILIMLSASNILLFINSHLQFGVWIVKNQSLTRVSITYCSLNYQLFQVRTHTWLSVLLGLYHISCLRRK